MTALTPGEMEVLEFERTTFRYLGVKEGVVFQRWNYSLARHYQRLHAIIDRPEAEQYDPTLVRRLRRQRDTRQAARSARREGWRRA